MGLNKTRTLWEGGNEVKPVGNPRMLVVVLQSDKPYCFCLEEVCIVVGGILRSIIYYSA